MCMIHVSRHFGKVNQFINAQSLRLQTSLPHFASSQCEGGMQNEVGKTAADTARVK